MTTTVLFCADPLAPRRVDPHFAREADAVRALGGDVALVDHDRLLRGHVAGRTAGPVLYRGWMLPPDAYTALAAAGPLVTSPAAYARAHELPGWYGAFADLTPASEWIPGPAPGRDALAAVAARLGPGPAIVKDYVKSRKHEWTTACFVPSLADVDGLARVVAEMVRLQGDALAGGVVVRRFEEFRPAPGEPAELRVWWWDGEPILVTPHPDAGPPTRLPEPDLAAVAAAVSRLDVRFAVTDLARGTAGWRVVEVGDGQVSDLHPDVPAAELWRPLLARA